ncbi:2-oxo-4-hydroxy-4-carboxy-5-ureidoimidazoline decarboxylase [Reinekea marinisedimentorum]|uniref:2-oxo-4-hydroxy-4-carboxy-5-ureidoimidazoline decarboxylase n=1 Tax=Reinekea marinisedimentorum TaxID=230495 RepID=A0A4R3I0B1_9GAMM|nr:2-oxo-4-hydroxy-4-carboxy-5-ureidoimidazoline decarboxylase [Reinekea marinisedimentorum]TCS38958.1 2-oxo-4-hydroxy-4-carboxy-5-ureidoimidazoline decarboxylase [Reinekea marinisedimentorum]
MTIEQLNALTADELANVLKDCCAAKNWVNGMVSVAPFKSEEILISAANRIWQALNDLDYLSAFEAHPRIGDVTTLKKKYASTQLTAGKEQAGMTLASDCIIERMKELNDAYNEKFGFIFIVCATGKSAGEMLELIEQRINNEYEQEITIAAAEQMKITEIRLKKLLE